MEQPAHYGGPELKVLLKNPKSDCKGEFEKLISCLKSSSKKTKQIKVRECSYNIHWCCILNIYYNE